MNKEKIPDEERRIMNVFNVSSPKKIPLRTNESMKVYFNFLSEKLIFPIKGSFTQETAPLHDTRYSIVLHRLSAHYDDFYGILSEGKIERKKAVVPLVDFIAESEEDINSQLIDDYKNWFCNW